MTPADYTALCRAVAARPLGAFGDALGAALASELPPHDIVTPRRLAHFVAQTSHETGGYRYLIELGGPTYCAKYDGRRDLGNVEPGDGFRFKGRGLIQITGRLNYRTYGEALGLDLIGDPDLAAEMPAAASIAALFWADHGLNALADADDIERITRRINGGLNGLADRKLMLARAKAHLGIP